MKLVPLDDRVVLQRLEAEEKTQGGIVLPDTAKEKPQKGKVIAVGPGRLLDDGTRAAVEVKVGDTVLFGRYAGTEVTIDRKEYVIMKESELLARLR
jgi:chaperonin GroES